MRRGLLTGVNLLHLRQRQSDFIPVQHRVLRLQRVALKVHGVEFLLVAQLFLELVKGRELVVGRPDFLKVAEMSEAGEVGDGVVGNVEDAEGWLS